jgi:hypothetical protein
MASRAASVGRSSNDARKAPLEEELWTRYSWAMPQTYRESAERAPLPAEERRWYTKQGDDIKGPYKEYALVRAVTDNKLRRSTLVRMEGEADWRPLSEVAELESQVSPLRAAAPFDARGALAHVPTGSYRPGFAAGFFGGIIGFAAVSIFAHGTETKRGARHGWLVQIVTLLGFRAVLLLLKQRMP